MTPQDIARMGDKLRAIITHYGVMVQRNELIQKLLELAAAVKKNNPNAIAEGIADVLVVYKQLCIVDEHEYNYIPSEGLRLASIRYGYDVIGKESKIARIIYAIIALEGVAMPNKGKMQPLKCTPYGHAHIIKGVCLRLMHDYYIERSDIERIMRKRIDQTVQLITPDPF